VRTYANLRRYSDASAILDYVEQGNDFPKDLKADLALTRSYVYIQQSQYDHAVEPMKTAINETNNKKEAPVTLTILAQLYQLTGNYKSANQDVSHR
jgi:Tfp pilus assembly protein PilF